MLSPRAIAVEGVGYGALVLALVGFAAVQSGDVDGLAVSALVADVASSGLVTDAATSATHSHAVGESEGGVAASGLTVDQAAAELEHDGASSGLLVVP